MASTTGVDDEDDGDDGMAEDITPGEGNRDCWIGADSSSGEAGEIDDDDDRSSDGVDGLGAGRFGSSVCSPSSSGRRSTACIAAAGRSRVYTQ